MEPDITERIIKIEWSVKGYHAFRLKPHSDIYLNVIEEPNNPYSTDVMSVVMPSLANIPAYLHNSESDFAGQHGGQQMRNIAGRQIGRVPANLCSGYKNLLQRNLVNKIVCKITGPPQLCSNLPSHQRFQQRNNPRVRDRPGGGAELPCSYYVYIKKQRFEDAMHVLEASVSLAELDARVHA